MSGHTSGPWIIDGVEIRAVSSHESESICEMSPCFNHADASVIAATPDLLKALEAAVADYDQIAAAPDEMDLDWVDDARAAIAKAKGIKS